MKQSLAFQAFLHSSIRHYELKNSDSHLGYHYLKLVDLFREHSSATDSSSKTEKLRAISKYLAESLKLPPNFASMPHETLIRVQGSASFFANLTYYAGVLTMTSALACQFYGADELGAGQAVQGLSLGLFAAQNSKTSVLRMWSQIALFLYRVARKYDVIQGFQYSTPLINIISPSQSAIAADVAFMAVAFVLFGISLFSGARYKAISGGFALISLYYSLGDYMFYMPTVEGLETEGMEDVMVRVIKAHTALPSLFLDSKSLAVNAAVENFSDLASTMWLWLFPVEEFMNFDDFARTIQSDFNRFSSDTALSKQKFISGVKIIFRQLFTDMKYALRGSRASQNRVIVDSARVPHSSRAIVRRVWDRVSRGKGKVTFISNDLAEMKTYDDMLSNANKVKAWFEDDDFTDSLGSDVLQIEALLPKRLYFSHFLQGKRDIDLHDAVLLFWYQMMNPKISYREADRSAAMSWLILLTKSVDHVPDKVSRLFSILLPATFNFNPNLASDLQHLRNTIESRSVRANLMASYDRNEWYSIDSSKQFISVLRHFPRLNLIKGTYEDSLKTELHLLSVMKKWKAKLASLQSPESSEWEVVTGRIKRAARAMQDPLNFEKCNVLDEGSIDTLESRQNLVGSMKESWMKHVLKAFSTYYSRTEGEVSLAHKHDFEDEAMQNIIDYMAHEFFVDNPNLDNSLFKTVYRLDGATNPFLREIYAINKSLLWVPILFIASSPLNSQQINILNEYKVMIADLGVKHSDIVHFISFATKFLGITSLEDIFSEFMVLSSDDL